MLSSLKELSSIGDNEKKVFLCSKKIQCAVLFISRYPLACFKTCLCLDLPHCLGFEREGDSLVVYCIEERLPFNLGLGKSTT